MKNSPNQEITDERWPTKSAAAKIRNQQGGSSSAKSSFTRAREVKLVRFFAKSNQFGFLQVQCCWVLVLVDVDLVLVVSFLHAQKAVTTAACNESY